MEEIELNNDELRSTTVSKLDGDPKVGWLCNKNGLLLKTYGWVVQNAIGIILLIHGLKSHTRLTFMRINLKMPNNNEGIIVDTDNYYIYKDSWIEKFNQNGYSVYALDFQGHGESQSLGNVRGDFNYYDDLVDDVIQYMNQIQDEIENDNQTNGDISNDSQMNDESYIVPTKKKRLPMYIIGHSMGGSIAIRILQLLQKEKKNSIQSGDANNYKTCKAILDNSTNINEMDNDMYYMNNSNGYGSDNSCASTSATINDIASGKDKGCYNYLDNLNIKGCVTLSCMLRLKTPFDSGNKSFKYFYLPITNFLSRVAPHTLISSESHYKRSEYVANICKYDKFRNNNGIKFKCMSELMKATITLNGDINYMPKNIPILFVHSRDDNICCYKGTVLFHSKAKVKKNNIHIVDDMGHAITSESGNEELLKTIIDWISDVRSHGEYEDEEEEEDEDEDGICFNNAYINSCFVFL
ncbi:lysophospholipase, putative [Plasmodium chabaudi chabaudi]|uniref:Lysophospholipase, putative n=2 Tax=Plasmodium chabaudi chabaudi TaxID=31271 RepID=A0A1C6XCR2_PLACU|nr:lysophospholipase, putative [Plasmodium chabaudi chabaudi]SCM03356.1 lysophospholipase, putative [Plasmodium chabaudi chabaudi]